jgi:hypothetical protein
LRVVVNLVGDAAHGQLAESRFVQRPFLPGGEHNAYELAFAAAQCGYDVELRGWLDQAAFRRLSEGAGVAPRVALAPRRATGDDLVVVPEGWRDPLEYARILLSPARVALFVLAAPGLFGWPFSGPGWTAPDPLSVALDTLATPAHFQAMHGAGFHLLTHSPGLEAAAQAAGVPCAFVGTGRPIPPVFPAGTERDLDAVGLLANRWGPFVRDVAADLDGLTVELLDESPNDVILERLAGAKVLIWPSRIEGHATIPWEARTMGCVPVALSSNRFAVGLRPETGAVLVDEVEQIAPAVRALLADEPRRQELSQRARATAPQEVAWESYVQRVGAFLDAVATAGPERAAFDGMGDALQTWLQARSEQNQSALTEMRGELERVRADRDAVHSEHAQVRKDRDELASQLHAYRTEEERVRSDRDRLAGDLAYVQAELDRVRAIQAEQQAVLGRKSVRMALRVEQLGRRPAG